MKPTVNKKLVLFFKDSQGLKFEVKTVSFSSITVEVKGKEREGK